MRTGDEVMAADVELIRAVAEALYGEQPAHALSRGLNINTRTVQRWLSGQNAVSPWMWRRLVELVASRERQLAELREEMTELAADEE